jgi:hypothetical protein
MVTQQGYRQKNSAKAAQPRRAASLSTKVLVQTLSLVFQIKQPCRFLADWRLKVAATGVVAMLQNCTR